MNMDENYNDGANLNEPVEETSQIRTQDSNIAIDSDENKTLLSSTPELKLALTWTDISYVVSEFNWLPTLAKNRPFLRSSERKILHPQSGQLSSGCLMALIGKSGAGKSTLIESLTGRRTKGLRGSVSINIDSEYSPFVREKDIKIAFIPQTDMLYGTLTVSESILFATKLKNRGFSPKEHRTIIERLLKELDLNACKDNRLSRCSGGEKKRLSVAMELVTKSNILVLDEPTSGLDSASAFHCVKLLRNLTRSTNNPLAIMVSIHQPSAKLLEEFHALYLLSYDGRCLYNGPVKNLLSVFTTLNVPCPQYHNPADHALEVSSGDYGKAVVDAMAVHASNNQKFLEFDNTIRYSVSSIIEKMRNHSGTSIFSHCSTLTERNFVTTFRDPILNYSRLLLQVVVGGFMIAIFGSKIGKETSCLGPETTTLTSLSRGNNPELNGLLFQNIGLLIISSMITLFVSIMPIVLVFPTEMTVFLRERTNGWYSCLSFYLAKTIADTPFLVIYTAIYSCMIYYPTGQENENWRFACFLMITILVALFGQSLGFIIGIVFVKNATAAAFMGPIAVVPFTLFSGFFVKTRFVPTYLKIFCHLSVLRYAFEAMVVTLYGFSRCSLILEEHHESLNNGIFKLLQYLSTLDLSYAESRSILRQIALTKNRSLSELESFEVSLANFTTSHFSLMETNRNESILMQDYALEDYYLWSHTVILVTFVIILKVLAYFLLLLKANKNN